MLAAGHPCHQGNHCAGLMLQQQDLTYAAGRQVHTCPSTDPAFLWFRMSLMPAVLLFPVSSPVLSCSLVHQTSRGLHLP